MSKKIALLRGINVSGKKKILMADLRELLRSNKFAEVETYIQSGNIVFASALDTAACEALISKVITEHYGWEVPVLVKLASEIEDILNNCPFSEEKKIKSYFTLLSEVPSEEQILTTNSVTYPNEEFKITSNCVYFFSENSYGNAKCNNNFFEKKLKVSATTRNYRTIVKLIEMATISENQKLPN